MCICVYLHIYIYIYIYIYICVCLQVCTEGEPSIENKKEGTHTNNHERGTSALCGNGWDLKQGNNTQATGYN